MMADPRETILARLSVIFANVEGVAATARNAADVPGLARPAVLLHDGAEQVLDKPQAERQSRLQRIELSPNIVILVATTAAEVGALFNLYRARVLKAVLQDPEILALLAPSGEIRYEGCTLEPATAESKEGRLELNLVFAYVFRTSDL